MLTTVLLLLLVATNHMSETCKGKAKAKAASAATAGQENKNAASTTINMGDTALLGNYHEESVLMSVGVVFFCAFSAPSERGQQPRVMWSNMSLRNRRYRSDEERGGSTTEGTRGPKTNRCGSLDDLGE